LSRKTLYETELIGYYVGRVIMGLGLVQIIPLVTALAYSEVGIVNIFFISSSISLFIGGLFIMLCKGAKSRRLGWAQGMAVAAISWFLGMLLSAIPYFLSGQYLSYLDCCFDVMSGFTTTGLVLIQNLDHASNGINMWRHLLTFIGGQGMVVLILTFLSKGSSGAYKMYVGEAKDEQIMPNAISTSRTIWLISILYLVIGTAALWIDGMIIGLDWDRALLHGMWVYMAGWSTGGFAPQSSSILYYHSLSFEIITMVFFIIGSFNFALHYAVLRRKKNEIIKNIEIQSMAITTTIFTLITVAGLMKANVYPNIMSLFRKGFYQLISGHTTTGFMTIYSKQFLEWGDLALIAMILVMLIGASACSTAGGFKGLRMGIIFSSIKKEVKKMVMPEEKITLQKYHHIKDTVLEDNVAKSAMMIVLLYIVTFVIGTIMGVFCGYPVLSSAFESASVTGNVGLSIGITQAAMPSVLKVTYIIIMWVARLEFMSVLALGAYLFNGVKKKI